jgi:hypothetical protein
MARQTESKANLAASPAEPPAPAAAKTRRVSRRASRPRRPWAVSAIALLLVLEAAGFLGMAALYLGPQGTQRVLTPELWGADRIAMLTGLVFALLAALALLAAVGFLRLARGAWTTAVMVQGANLFIALVLYFGGRPAYVYVMMVYGLLMVLYLHQADVRAAFATETSEQRGPAP